MSPTYTLNLKIARCARPRKGQSQKPVFLAGSRGSKLSGSAEECGPVPQEGACRDGRSTRGKDCPAIPLHLCQRMPDAWRQSGLPHPYSSRHWNRESHTKKRPPRDAGAAARSYDRRWTGFTPFCAVSAGPARSDPSARPSGRTPAPGWADRSSGPGFGDVTGSFPGRALEDGLELVQFEGLVEVRVHPLLHRSLLRLFRGIGGHQDHLGVR